MPIICENYFLFQQLWKKFNNTITFKLSKILEGQVEFLKLIVQYMIKRAAQKNLCIENCYEMTHNYMLNVSWKERLGLHRSASTKPISQQKELNQFY